MTECVAFFRILRSIRRPRGYHDQRSGFPRRSRAVETTGDGEDWAVFVAGDASFIREVCLLPYLQIALSDYRANVM